MKKTIIFLAVLFSLTALGQKNKSKDSTVKQSTTEARDTSIQINDSTALIQVRDYDDFNKEIIGELPAKYADVIRGWWVGRFQRRIGEFIKPKNK